VGLGVFPSHALNIVTSHVSIFNKKESKHLFRFEDSVGCPQIVKTRGKWSKSLHIDVVALIFPPPPPPRIQVLTDNEFINVWDN
jgi:hypothetical protein